MTYVGADQPPLLKVQRLQPKAGALSDSDVHRILAHRRAYLKQQRAFDRACVDSNEAFDPTQVSYCQASMSPFLDRQKHLRRVWRCFIDMHPSSLHGPWFQGLRQW